MRTKERHRRAEREHRGLISVELLFAVPVLLLLLLAAVVYGRVMTVRCAATHAATVAAREAGKGGDVREIAGAVSRVLAPYGVAVTPRPGSGTKVVLQDGFGKVREYGDPSMVYVKPRGVAAGEILSTVWIRTTARKANGATPLIPSFGGLGAVLHTGEICVSSLAKKDR